jgi:hypothetical protein
MFHISFLARQCRKFDSNDNAQEELKRIFPDKDDRDAFVKAHYEYIQALQLMAADAEDGSECVTVAYGNDSRDYLKVRLQGVTKKSLFF